MRHTCGLTDKGEIAERINHIFVNAKTTEHGLCMGLEKQGLMVKIGDCEEEIIFSLTDQGKRFVLSNTPKSEAS